MEKMFKLVLMEKNGNSYVIHKTKETVDVDEFNELSTRKFMFLCEFNPLDAYEGLGVEMIDIGIANSYLFGDLIEVDFNGKKELYLFRNRINGFGLYPFKSSIKQNEFLYKDEVNIPFNEFISYVSSNRGKVKTLNNLFLVNDVEVSKLTSIFNLDINGMNYLLKSRNDADYNFIRLFFEGKDYHNYATSTSDFSSKIALLDVLGNDDFQLHYLEKIKTDKYVSIYGDRNYNFFNETIFSLKKIDDLHEEDIPIMKKMKKENKSLFSKLECFVIYVDVDGFVYVKFKDGEKIKAKNFNLPIFLSAYNIYLPDMNDEKYMNNYLLFI